MAKRKYYQSPKSRMAESRGMERKLRGAVKHVKKDGFEEPLDPRRRREYEDSGMINEDVNAVANLPQDVKYHTWPRPRYENMYNLDDTVHGIDRQIDADIKGMKSEFDPEKY